MVRFLEKRKPMISRPDVQLQEINESVFRPSDYLESRVNVKVLGELKEKIEILDFKISQLESALHKNLSKLDSNDFDGSAGRFDRVLSEIEKLHSRVSELEKKFEERVPTKVLSEDNFREEVQDSGELVGRIISELKNLMQDRQSHRISDERLTLVESKRIDKIKSLLKRHEKLSSKELSQLIGLSRTRCNEYFKIMERLNIVRPVLVGKEKFYKIKGK
jgi:hypothetical protein